MGSRHLIASSEDFVPCGDPETLVRAHVAGQVLGTSFKVGAATVGDVPEPRAEMLGESLPIMPVLAEGIGDFFNNLDVVHTFSFRCLYL